MPELPEVETIARYLRPSLLGRKVISAQLLWPRTLAAPSLAQFHDRISGQTIQEVRRRGKFVILMLSTDALLIHLRMSGDLRVEADVGAVRVHDRLILTLDDGMRLAFEDTRKFGRAWLVEDPASVTASLGPEPMEDSFTADLLYWALQSRRRILKSLLLDQAFIAGLGNIYTDESLYRARLHPLTPSRSVSIEQAQALWQAIRETLLDGIRLNGASIDWVYRGGDFQNHFRVYQRTGQPCLQCGGTIERILVGQRGTHFCPVCQPLPDSE
jgi:formamidopyrimidine-DNA glycosylase